jgi:hypothetical protein
VRARPLGQDRDFSGEEPLLRLMRTVVACSLFLLTLAAPTSAAIRERAAPYEIRLFYGRYLVVTDTATRESLTVASGRRGAFSAAVIDATGRAAWVRRRGVEFLVEAQVGHGRRRTVSVGRGAVRALRLGGGRLSWQRRGRRSSVLLPSPRCTPPRRARVLTESSTVVVLRRMTFIKSPDDELLNETRFERWACLRADGRVRKFDESSYGYGGGTGVSLAVAGVGHVAFILDRQSRGGPEPSSLYVFDVPDATRREVAYGERGSFTDIALTDTLISWRSGGEPRSAPLP